MKKEERPRRDFEIKFDHIKDVLVITEKLGEKFKLHSITVAFLLKKLLDVDLEEIEYED